MARTIALLCSLGDITVSWEAKDDVTMAPIIQRLLDSKVRFHILRKRKTIMVEKATQAMDARKVILPDASLQQLFASGVLTVGALLMGETTGEIAKTAQDVLENDTVATQAPAGG